MSLGGCSLGSAVFIESCSGARVVWLSFWIVSCLIFYVLWIDDWIVFGMPFPGGICYRDFCLCFLLVYNSVCCGELGSCVVLGFPGSFSSRKLCKLLIFEF